MRTAAPDQDPEKAALERLRQLFARRGPRGMEGLEPFWQPWLVADAAGADPWREAAQYEVLGYDALAAGRPGPARACLEAAAALYHAHGAGVDGAQATLAAAAVLDAWFPAYGGAPELLGDVAAWLAARLRALAPGGAEGGGAEEETLRYRWVLRLEVTARRGDPTALHELAARLGLDAAATALLAAAVALQTEPALAPARRALGEAPGLPAGLLVEALGTSDDEREALRAGLDPRAPLRRLAAVRLWGPDDLALDARPLSVDDAVVARLRGRDAWPEALADVARPPAPGRPGRGPAPREARRALDRALREQAEASVVAVRAASVAETRDLAEAWCAAAAAALIEVRLDADPDALTPRAARVLAREARLRDALVLATGARGALGRPAVAAALGRLEEVAPDLPVPLVVDAGTADEGPLRARLAAYALVALEPPPAAERRALWEAALEAEALAPLDPAALDRLAALPATAMAIGRAARAAALEARLAAAPGRAPRATEAGLRRHLEGGP